MNKPIAGENVDVDNQYQRLRSGMIYMKNSGKEKVVKRKQPQKMIKQNKQEVLTSEQEFQRTPNSRKSGCNEKSPVKENIGISMTSTPIMAAKIKVRRLGIDEREVDNKCPLSAISITRDQVERKIQSYCNFPNYNPKYYPKITR